MTDPGKNISNQKNLICVMTDIVRAKDVKAKALHEALKIQNNLDTNKMALKDLKEEEARISNELAKLETNNYFLNIEEIKKLTAEIAQIQEFCSVFEKASNTEEKTQKKGQNKNSSTEKSPPAKMQGCPITVMLNEYVSTKTLKTVAYLAVFTLTITMMMFISLKNVAHQEQNSKMSLEDELDAVESLLAESTAYYPVPKDPPVAFTAMIHNATYDYAGLNEASTTLEYDDFVHVGGGPPDKELWWGNQTSFGFKPKYFICFYPGTYVITWAAGNITSDCHKDSKTRIILLKNGEIVGSTLRPDYGDHMGSEKLQLKSDDRVSLNITVRCLSTGSSLTAGMVTFMGHRVD